ncbi:MAG: hydrogenase formation protein HypD, partial [bacterium]|nr:hydrogenase formation protein HypD [bacterium]
NPDKKVVYFAIGFETTAPLTAAVIEKARGEGLENLFFHINHVLVPPAMDAVMDAPDVRVDAFIAPGHVSTITGWGIYREMAQRYGAPIVVSGFEPVDILESVLMITRQIAQGRSEAENQYTRAVTESGNRKARALVEKYFEVRSVFRWRGLGDIPDSGLQLKKAFAGLDAEEVFHHLLPWEPVDDHTFCICGEVLRGKAAPTECPGFGNTCTPKSPVGACMVSSEGACHAYFSYQEV